MKLASIVLKLDKNGSCVTLPFVTPAEVCYLVSDHHSNAGGNPILSLREHLDDEEEHPLALLHKELDDLETKLLQLDDMELTDEIRTRRENSLRNRIEGKQSTIKVLEGRQAFRKLTPVQERARLCAKYGTSRVNAFFSGRIPTLPEDFDEAQQAGLQSSIPSQRLVTVGDEVPA